MKKICLLSLVLFLSLVFLEKAQAYPHFLGNKVVCPVNGEIFDIKKDSKKIKHGGKVYFFCCADCAALFSADRKKYVEVAEKKKGEKKTGTEPNKK